MSKLSPEDYLFTRVFMQTAYISLLEELKDQLQSDLEVLSKLPCRDDYADEIQDIIQSAQKKIEIANKSTAKLKKEF